AGQPAFMILVAAPAAALIVRGIGWFITRKNELPYGPYICVSAVTVLTFWGDIWSVAWSRFYPWWLIPGVLAVGFGLLFLLLSMLRILRARRSAEQDEIDEPADAPIAS